MQWTLVVVKCPSSAPVAKDKIQKEENVGTDVAWADYGPWYGEARFSVLCAAEKFELSFFVICICIKVLQTKV